MPLVSQTFDQLFTFTRTTAATFVGSNGLIQTTPASVNLLTFTQEFDNAAWTKSSVAVIADSTTAPDGTSTADTLTASGANGTTLQTFTATAVPYVFSVWLRRLTGTGNVQITVDGTTYTTAAVTSSWTRFQTTLTPSAGSRTAGVRIVTSSDAVYMWGAQLELGSTATTYTRNNGGVYPARFDYDPVTLLPKGILSEEQRVNLVLQSQALETTWSRGNILAFGSGSVVNAIAAPDGTTTAEFIVPDTTGGVAHFMAQSVSHTAASYTISAYVKAGAYSKFAFRENTTTGNYATFNIGTGAVIETNATASIQNAGNGWYRCTLTYTGAAVSQTMGLYVLPAAYTSGSPHLYFWAGDGTSGLYMWGVQDELGAFATSYIATVASQVTRAADQCSIVAPMFAPWYNQSEGTFVTNFTPDEGLTANVSRVLNVSQGGVTGRVVDLYTNGSSYVNYNGTVATAFGTASVTNTPQKIAIAYKTNDYAYVQNAGTVTAVASSLVNAATQMAIGNTGGVDQLNGHIRSIRYYPTRLPDAQLQALTA